MSVDIKDAEYSYLLPSFARVCTQLTLTTSSNVIGSNLATGVYLMSSTVDAHVVQGSSPTANTDHWVMSAGTTYPIRVDTQSGLKVAARSVSGSGVLRILRVD